MREKFDISQSVEKKRYAVKIYCVLYLQHTNNTTQSCQKIWQIIQFLWMCKQSKLDHHELYNSFPLMRGIPQGLGVQLCDRLPQSNHEMQQVSFYFISKFNTLETINNNDILLCVASTQFPLYGSPNWCFISCEFIWMQWNPLSLTFSFMVRVGIEQEAMHHSLTVCRKLWVDFLWISCWIVSTF